MVGGGKILGPDAGDGAAATLIVVGGLAVGRALPQVVRDLPFLNGGAVLAAAASAGDVVGLGHGVNYGGCFGYCKQIACTIFRILEKVIGEPPFCHADRVVVRSAVAAEQDLHDPKSPVFPHPDGVPSEGESYPLLL